MIKIYNKYKEIINYLICGLITTIVSLISYYFLVYTILNPNVSIELQIANIISWIIGVIVAYITNRKYVFASKSTNIKKELSSFTISRISTLLLDMLIMFLFVTLLHFNDKVFKIISQILVIISNYLLSKLFVFKK